MKKILFILFLLLGFGVVNAQEMDYYGAGNAWSNNLRIADGDSVTGEYFVTDKLIYLQVDSNWTASNIAILVYNPVEETYEILTDEDGATIEYVIVQGKTTNVLPIQMAGAKHIKFAKMTSGSYVPQSGAASTVIPHSIRY